MLDQIRVDDGVKEVVVHRVVDVRVLIVVAPFFPVSPSGFSVQGVIMHKRREYMFGDKRSGQTGQTNSGEEDGQRDGANQRVR